VIIENSYISLEFSSYIYFDLENPQDLARLEQPQLALEDLTGLIIIDEIQRQPDLFPLLRYLVDQEKKRKFVILGSASRDLIRQSSESLAGRIAYFQLGGFRLSDIDPGAIRCLWQRGGLPRSFLAATDDESLLWRNQYVSTFLERDIPQLGITIPARTLRRFWTIRRRSMCSPLRTSLTPGIMGKRAIVSTLGGSGRWEKKSVVDRALVCGLPQAHTSGSISSLPPSRSLAR